MDKKLIFVVALLLPFLASCSAPVGIVKNNVELPKNDKPEIKLAKLDPSAMEQLQHEQDGAFHVAGAGETLKQVCEVYGLDLAKVAKINKIEAPYSLKEGDAIFLPAQALLPEEKSIAVSSNSDKGSKSCGVKRATRQTVVNALLGKKDPSVPMLKFPVPKGVLTSPFGYRWGRFHKGLDIAAPIGSPVLSCADGKIMFTGTRKKFRRYGNTVLVDHGKGAYTYYAHLSEILVKKGQFVRKGQKIALVGNSGRSTGPHLHLEVRVSNTMYNPLAYFAPQEITGTLMAARFRETPMGPIRAKWQIPDLLTASK